MNITLQVSDENRRDAEDSLSIDWSHWGLTVRGCRQGCWCRYK